MTKYYMIVDKTKNELISVTTDKKTLKDILKQRKRFMSIDVIEQSSSDAPPDIKAALKRQSVSSITYMYGFYLLGSVEDDLVHTELPEEIKNIYETAEEMISLINYLNFTEEEYDAIDPLYLLLNQIIGEFEEAQYNEEHFWGETIDTEKLVEYIVKEHYKPEDRKGR